MTRTLGVFDAVIFDFDGTLADSTAAIVRAASTWATEFGVEPRHHSQFTGLPSDVMVRALLPADRFDEAHARIEELEIEDVADVIALPGALEALQSVPAERAAIATSCSAPLLDSRMVATALPRPSVVVTRDEVVLGKPAPESFELAARRLGFPAERCLVVEDAPAGVVGGRGAGCSVLGVLTHHTEDELGAHWHVTNLSQVAFEARADGVAVVWA
ncbi:HAD-IA family hydrolase [Tessaracoccus sp. Y36]